MMKCLNLFMYLLALGLYMNNLQLEIEVFSVDCSRLKERDVELLPVFFGYCSQIVFFTLNE